MNDIIIYEPLLLKMNKHKKWTTKWTNVKFFLGSIPYYIIALFNLNAHECCDIK